MAASRYPQRPPPTRPWRLGRAYFAARLRGVVAGIFLSGFILIPAALSTEESSLIQERVARDASQDFAVAVAARDDHQPARASELLQGIIAANPQDAWGRRARFLAGCHALEDGDVGQAIAWLSKLTLAGANLEDYRNYLLALAFERENRPLGAIDHLGILWERYPDFAYRTDVGLRLAGLLEKISEPRRTLAVLRQLAANLEPGAAHRSVLERLAPLERRHGDATRAAAVLRDLAVRYPSSPLWRVEMASPDSAITPEALLESLSTAERLTRAGALIEAGDFETALVELGAIDPAELGADERSRHLLARGRALAGSKHLAEANTVLEGVASVPADLAGEAFFERAQNFRALAKAERAERVTVRHVTRSQKVVSGRGKKMKVRTVKKRVRVEERHVDKAAAVRRAQHLRRAIEAYQRAAAIPALRPSLAQEALEGAFVLAVEVKDESTALAAGRALRQRFPSNKTTRERLWKMAWDRYQRNTDPGGGFMGEVSEATGDINARRRAAYWQGRALEKHGRRSRAIEVYADLARTAFPDYFGYHARERLETLATESTLSTEARRALAAAPAGTPALAAAVPASQAEPWQKATELRSMGLYQHAIKELERQPLAELPRALVTRIAELRFLMGERAAAYAILREEYPELGTALQAVVPEDVRRVYYPLEYADLVRENAASNDLDPFLVFGVIRQESAGNSDAMSHAGARGLMQIMPATGRYLAGVVGHQDYETVHLHDPAVSIRFGTSYLSEGVDLFGGNVELALAGYNAGPGRILNWWRGRGRRDLPEFVESLPLDETRSYVQRVVHHTSVYRQMYAPWFTPRTETAESRRLLAP